MSKEKSRSDWGARAPKNRVTVAKRSRSLFVLHHSAGPRTQTVRAIQDFHMGPARNWSDIGYNKLVDEDGTRYNGRGWDVAGAHAANYNTAGVGVCYIGDNDPTDAAKIAIRRYYDEACAHFNRKLTMTYHGKLNGHRSNSCPGSKLAAWVDAGMPIDDLDGGDTKPAPKPTPVPVGQVVGPGTEFPLPTGMFFGSAKGGNESVSGVYLRRFKGKTDREWIKHFVEQLVRRGWPAGKDRTYLTKFGNDGVFGTELQTLVRAFRTDQGISAAGGTITKQVWDKAFKGKVTA